MVLGSVVAREVDRVLTIVTATSVALLAGITVAMIYFVIRFREKRSPRAVQITGSRTLEILWTAIPTVIVLFFFYLGYRGFLVLRTVPPNAKVVRVTGQQWSWIYDYPEEGLTVTDKLVVPAGGPIKIELRSNDVLHSFYLPDFRVKEDALPSKSPTEYPTYLWFDPDRPGTYSIFCAEFCGKDHAMMLSELIVLPPEEFEAWVRERKEEKYRPVDIAKAMDPASAEIKGPDPDHPRGARLYATHCAGCHGPDGRGGLVAQARNFTTLEGWKAKRPTVGAIFRTMTEGIPGTQMRSFAHLAPWDRFAIAHHVAAFYTGQPPRPQDTEEEIEALVADYELDKTSRPPPRLPIEEAIELYAKKAAGAGEK